MSDFRYLVPDGEGSVSFSFDGDLLRVDEQTYPCDGRNVWIGGRKIPFWTHQVGDKISVWLDGEVFSFSHIDPRRRSSGTSAAAGFSSGLVRAQMPGKILSLSVKVGDTVEPGQNLLIMESMKMELALDAPIGGTVESLDVTVGDLVAQGAQLAHITPLA